MAGHYPGILLTGHIGKNTPKFVPPRWGRPLFDPTQTGLCKFGWVWSSLTFSKRESIRANRPTKARTVVTIRAKPTNSNPTFCDKPGSMTCMPSTTALMKEMPTKVNPATAHTLVWRARASLKQCFTGFPSCGCKFQKGLEVCYCLWGVPSRPWPGSYAEPVQVPSRVRGDPDSPCALFYSVSCQGVVRLRLVQ